MKTRTRSLTIFSWGYWGWGTETKRLVRVVDQVEAARGFSPPMFVEVRLQRGGRAPGFRGDAFKKTLGKDRYHWMPKLGNKRIASGRGKRVQIAEPTAVGKLLDLALEQVNGNRRIIFFCACVIPAHCHRAEVARLLHAAAQQRGTALETIEWPGGEPKLLELEISRELLAKVRAGRRSIPLPKSANIAEYAGIPWYSSVQLFAGDDKDAALCGPALYSRKSGWHLRVLSAPHGREKPALASKHMKEFREESGYQAVG